MISKSENEKKYLQTDWTYLSLNLLNFNQMFFLAHTKMQAFKGETDETKESNGVIANDRGNITNWDCSWIFKSLIFKLNLNHI